MRDIREFFYKRDVMEVETPQMANAAVTDPHIECFSVNQKDSANTQTYFLQSSPEYAMKRLLCAGMGDIYQICKAFRVDESGRYHNPEFTMLEWYRLGYSMEDLIEEIAALVGIVTSVNDYRIKSYQSIFIEQLDIDPISTDVNELKRWIIAKQGEESWIRDEDNIDTLLQFIFAFYIEPNLGYDMPQFVTYFPASQASLAKIDKNNSKLALRFELYINGVEIANGFEELQDGHEQHKRFRQDNDMRVTMGKESMLIDNRFLAALNQGLPECAGVALGLDRLLMVALDADHIDKVITFPIESA